jgi:mono/diheme cytochrome c family protein
MLIARHRLAAGAGLTLLITLTVVLSEVLPILAVPRADKKETKADSWASALRKAPAEAASRANPYDGQPEAAAAGRKLFRRHCEECHGQQGKGTKWAPALVSGPVQAAAPGTLYWFLTNGELKQGMPSWSGLPNQQRWQLVCYLKSLE